MVPTHPMAGDSVQEQTHRSRVWTIPNLLSMVRPAGVPVFLWLVLGPEADRARAGAAHALRRHRLARRLPRTRSTSTPPWARSSTSSPTASTSSRWWSASRCATSSPGGWPSSCPCATCCCGAWCPSCAPAATAPCRCTSWARPRPSTCSTPSRCSSSARATARSRCSPRSSAGPSPSGGSGSTGGPASSTPGRCAPARHRTTTTTGTPGCLTPPRT